MSDDLLIDELHVRLERVLGAGDVAVDRVVGERDRRRHPLGDAGAVREGAEVARRGAGDVERQATEERVVERNRELLAGPGRRLSRRSCLARRCPCSSCSWSRPTPRRTSPRCRTASSVIFTPSVSIAAVSCSPAWEKRVFSLADDVDWVAPAWIVVGDSPCVPTRTLTRRRPRRAKLPFRPVLVAWVASAVTLIVVRAGRGRGRRRTRTRRRSRSRCRPA